MVDLLHEVAEPQARVGFLARLELPGSDGESNPQRRQPLLSTVVQVLSDALALPSVRGRDPLRRVQPTPELQDFGFDQLPLIDPNPRDDHLSRKRGTVAARLLRHA